MDSVSSAVDCHCAIFRNGEIILTDNRFERTGFSFKKYQQLCRVLETTYRNRTLARVEYVNI
jgi:hypothetical protein